MPPESDPRLYLLLAELVLLVHVLFVAFVVLGQLAVMVGCWRGWRWVRLRWLRYLHFAAIGFVVLGTWIGAVCPLTRWESQLRVLGGEQGYAGSFIGDWLARLLYYHAPGWVFTLVYTVFGALVAATLWRCPPRRRDS